MKTYSHAIRSLQLSSGIISISNYSHLIQCSQLFKISCFVSLRLSKVRFLTLYFLQAYMIACVWNCYRYVTGRGSSEILLYVTTNDTTVSHLGLPIFYQDQRHNMVEDLWQRQREQCLVLIGLSDSGHTGRENSTNTNQFTPPPPSLKAPMSITFQIRLCKLNFLHHVRLAAEPMLFTS